MPPRRIEGPLYAFRAWRLRGSGLHSFWGGRAWPDDRPQVGLCWRNFLPVRVHVAPGEGHNCGLYAWNEPPEDRYSPRGVIPVWGALELTGRVAVHARGYGRSTRVPWPSSTARACSPSPSATGWSCSRT